ncbi:MAG TPA: hypothetical protein VFD58_23280 [Blastocatellia bacterium]|nr:hypothetical protein [Blastocatellia bacterium]
MRDISLEEVLKAACRQAQIKTNTNITLIIGGGKNYDDWQLRAVIDGPVQGFYLRHYDQSHNRYTVRPEPAPASGMNYNELHVRSYTRQILDWMEEIKRRIAAGDDDESRVRRAA